MPSCLRAFVPSLGYHARVMPTITIDGQQLEAQDGQMILQAALDAGIDVPHYCYHPGLSIVASCRICLAEVEGVPKLLPTCQTPVREGMIVRTRTPRSIANQKQVMEYLLINHPLDCPVCDQAGECLLQDYSYEYGRAGSRFEEDKAKKPKKIVGEHVLLYNDRCIMCTRCIRFTREVSGGSELLVTGRADREEIDIFPGRPLNDNLSVNVADICPVGALLDRDFLFKQRVWLLKSARSISPADAGGENILLQYNEGVVYRIKPRFNAQVNQWWISNDTRYSYKIIHSEKRLRQAMMKRHGVLEPADFMEAANAAMVGLRQAAGGGGLYAVLSPMMACEEAYLLGRLIRELDKQATLVLGPVPDTGEDEVFKHYETGKETFRIQSEKVPNRRGVERVMEMLGGPTARWEDLEESPRAKFRAGWIVGGYLNEWASEVPSALKGSLMIVQDLLPTALSRAADVVLPAAAWAEKHGCWENWQNRIQAFEPAIDPPSGVTREGELFARLLGASKGYDVETIREEMGGAFADVQPGDEPHEAESPFEFAAL